MTHWSEYLSAAVLHDAMQNLRAARDWWRVYTTPIAAGGSVCWWDGHAKTINSAGGSVCWWDGHAKTVNSAGGA